MSVDVVIRKENEVYIKILTNRGIERELSDHFSFYVENYKFQPKYKSGIWDGKIKLYNTKNSTIYLGLLEEIKNFCESNDYTYEVDPELTSSIENIDIDRFINSLNIPEKYTPRDYQIESLKQAIHNRRMLLISVTGSGKSLILYLFIRYILQKTNKILFIVPNVALIHQMYKDLESYGFDSEKYIHKIHSGQEKISDKQIFLSTWQSIHNNDVNYFKQFDAVICDEVHLATATSLTKILSSCINAKYRIGATGSLDGSKTNEMSLKGLFGNIFRSTTTNELIDRGQLSNLDIKCLVLKHEQPDGISFRKFDYPKEVEYLITHEERNKFITNLALSLKNNTLILFNHIEKHGDKLFEMLSKSGRNVYYIHGNVEVEERERIREILQTESNAIICASYGTFSTGINAPNIHNIIFALSAKSLIRNIQSIGRVLRTNINKTHATLYDISDDLRTGKQQNFSLKHLLERLKIYDNEKFNYRLFNINLKNK